MLCKKFELIPTKIYQVMTIYKVLNIQKKPGLIIAYGLLLYTKRFIIVLTSHYNPICLIIMKVNLIATKRKHSL